MFSKTMSYTLRIALTSLALCLPARAEQIEVATGVLCDTQQQMERFVALYDGNASTAINAVNAEENDPTACVVATIAYVRGPELVTSRTKNGTFQIMQVLVVGIFSNGAFRASVPATFFSVERIAEQAA